MVHNLCSLYPALSPLTIECESFHNVIVLYCDVRRMQIRGESSSNNKNADKKVVRKRASDDAGWW